jgi:hypothetical protein
VGTWETTITEDGTHGRNKPLHQGTKKFHIFLGKI